MLGAPKAAPALGVKEADADEALGALKEKPAPPLGAPKPPEPNIGAAELPPKPAAPPPPKPPALLDPNAAVVAPSAGPLLAPKAGAPLALPNPPVAAPKVGAEPGAEKEKAVEPPEPPEPPKPKAGPWAGPPVAGAPPAPGAPNEKPDDVVGPAANANAELAPCPAWSSSAIIPSACCAFEAAPNAGAAVGFVKPAPNVKGAEAAPVLPVKVGGALLATGWEACAPKTNAGVLPSAARPPPNMLGTVVLVVPGAADDAEVPGKLPAPLADVEEPIEKRLDGALALDEDPPKVKVGAGVAVDTGNAGFCACAAPVDEEPVKEKGSAVLEGAEADDPNVVAPPEDAPNEKAPPLPAPKEKPPELPAVGNADVADPKENTGALSAGRGAVEPAIGASDFPPEVIELSPCALDIDLVPCVVVDEALIAVPNENGIELAGAELAVPPNENDDVDEEVLPNVKPVPDAEDPEVVPRNENKPFEGSAGLAGSESLLGAAPAATAASSSSSSLLPDFSRPTSSFFSGH